MTTEAKVYRLRFPADPLERSDETVWFDLPAAQKTSCLSLVVEESYAPSPKRHMAISEAIVLTEQPLIPLYFYTQVKLIKPWVSGDNGNLMDKLMLKWIRVDKKMKEHWLEHGTLPETETPPQAHVLP